MRAGNSENRAKHGGSRRGVTAVALIAAAELAPVLRSLTTPLLRLLLRLALIVGLLLVHRIENLAEDGHGLCWIGDCSRGGK
ncbi:hypothetical protein CCR91_02595 [Thiorhodovibrio winogradskyi]|nr:hypothetical protein [Thiorhodovibrio winogradskyi]